MTLRPKILKATAGIGTEATRAAIIETLLHREYLRREGKTLILDTQGATINFFITQDPH